MMNYQDTALRYANEFSYDSVRPARVRCGQYYFCIYAKALLGYTLDWVQFVKIAEYGSTSRVHNMAEQLWAERQELN